MTYQEIDQKALQLSKEFRRLEADLLAIITEVDRHKVFRKYGYNSLYQYVHQRLKISESQTYAFISVARKSHEIPKLQEFIQKGDLSINKAKRITSVINKDNQDQWLAIATNKTQKMLEREVAMAQPGKAIQEKTVYVSGNNPVPEKIQIKKNIPKIKLEVGLSEKTMLKLRRAQDLVSQKRRQPTNLEQTIEALVNDFINKQDPVEKAKRQEMRGKLIIEPSSKKKDSSKEQNYHGEHKESFKKVEPFSRKENQKSSKRKSLPTKTKHQVFLRDRGQCTWTGSLGHRCQSRRFLEIHHIKPVSQGGEDHLENLTLLCSGHHAVLHMK